MPNPLADRYKSPYCRVHDMNDHTIGDCTKFQGWLDMYNKAKAGLAAANASL